MRTASGPQSCPLNVLKTQKNLKGWVLAEFAQVEAAKAADQAARLVLREQQPTAMACIKFREHMQRILTDPEYGPLPGARVTGFQKVGVPRTTFP
jgi:hypothetical protein